MRKKLAVIIFIVGLNLFAISQVDAAIGFYFGPNYSIYAFGHSYDNQKNGYGFGLQSGFLAKTNTAHLASFRLDLLFSWTTLNSKINLYPQENNNYKSIDGHFNFYSINVSPQVQFNILKNKGLFICSGIAFRYMIINGNGTANRNTSSSEFQGKDFNYLFNDYVLAVTLSIGYQEFKIGKLTLFGELKESVDLSGMTYSYYTTPINSFNTSITIGIILFKEKKQNERN
jgi:hypothetical protein